ncbi:hypothetical protein LINGRAHAP2_LOCUS3314 [Linum grandiflorum]
MRGAKRRAASSSELAPERDAIDTAMNTKRVMGSYSDVHKAETSQSFDVQRAESSRQHVRALNSQFASWVQTQLKNHPDELWEDGVRDYLAHASSIMEKFSDVVNWLKANAGKDGLGAESSASDKKNSPETGKIEKNVSSESVFASKSASFGAPFTSSIFSNNQSSGAASSGPTFGLLQSNSQSSGAVSSSQNFGSLLSNSQSSGLFSFSSSQSTGLLANSQSTGLSSSSQISGLFSNVSKFGSTTNNQNAGLFSQSQTQSPGSVSNSQGVSLFSNNQTQSPELLSNSQGSGMFSNNQGAGLFTNGKGTASFSSSQTTVSFSSSPSSSIFSMNPTSSGGLFSSQAPLSFGGQSSAPGNNNASDDADDGEKLNLLSIHVFSYKNLFVHPLSWSYTATKAALLLLGDELPRPSSPSLKKAEEKGVVVVHEVKCKLYVKSIDPADKGAWKDKGPGQLNIKCSEGVSKGTKESDPTIIVRNDVGKVLLNALLYPGIKTSLQKNAIVAIFHVTEDDSGSSDSVARTFLIRTKTEADRDKLSTAISEYAPQSS